MDPLIGPYREAIDRWDWLGSQPTQRAALLAAARLRWLAPGEWAHGEGDEAAGLLGVLEGRLRLFAQAPGDREALIAVIGPGVAIGQSPLFGGGPRLVTAVSAGRSLVLTLSDASLRRVAETWPGVWQAISRLIYRQLQYSVQVAAERAALPPRAQLASRLLMLALGSETVAASQSDLAELMGFSRKAVNGWLGELEAAGAVRLGYGRIEILSRRALERAAALER
ncbi:MAG TPA: Crp/Fnr family transcriptional regulator [Caulobacter sp.]|nr:Crp/Fnr family transcriptional regulator [Caulobacter sp.]